MLSDYNNITNRNTLFIQLYRAIHLECQKSKKLYTRNYARLLIVNGTYMCRRFSSLCHSTLALKLSTIAHAAQINPRIHIAPRGTQHFWSDLLKGRCNLPPQAGHSRSHLQSHLVGLLVGQSAPLTLRLLSNLRSNLYFKLLPR